jgi:hydroxyacylglutathione hydrolase
MKVEAKAGGSMADSDKDRVIAIPLGAVNGYLVTAGREGILIDTGRKGKEQDIISALDRAGLSVRDVRLIIVTHTHYDHCGNLNVLKNMSGARILVHEEEAGCLERGYCEVPDGTLWLSKAISWVGRTLAKNTGHYEPASPDITVSARFDLQSYGIEGYVLPTPGHTSGSLSVVIEDRHALVGDTLFNILPHSTFPPFANDPETLLESWQTLLGTGCEFFYPGHGKPIARSRLEANYRKRRQ